MNLKLLIKHLLFSIKSVIGLRSSVKFDFVVVDNISKQEVLPNESSQLRPHACPHISALPSVNV